MKRIILLAAYLAMAANLLAEGTKELRPNQANIGYLHLTDNPTYTDFAQYGAPPEHQIKIQIADLTEQIFIGMNNRSRNGNYVNNVPFRVVSPSGVIVHSGIMPSAGQQGYIDNWNEAVAGPMELGFAGGYDAIELTPLEIGDYVIEFNPPGDLNIHLFDVTVANAADQVQLGRLHSQGWQISTESFNNPFYGKMYPYEPSGTLYEVDFNQMQPYLFVVNFNSTGTDSTGNFFNDRQSKEGNFTRPEFEVFLNPPPESLYPTNAPSLSFEASIDQIDCQTVEMCLTFTSNDAGYVEGFIDLNGNNIYDEDQGDIYFGEYLDQPGTTCVAWDGLDGDGNPIDRNEISLVSSFGFGVTHLPLYDVEHNRNGYIVKVVRPAGVDDPLIFWDDSNLNAGNTLGDPKVNLDGCSSAAGGCHKWENRGSIFTGNSGDQESINTWWYASLIYDTLIFNFNPTSSVQLSYLADSLVQGDTLICLGDSMDFFIYNDGNTHFDSSAYWYTWYLNGTQSNQDLNTQAEIINQYTEIVVEAVDKNNAACVSYDTLRVSAQDPIQIQADIIDETCEELGSINVTVTNGPPNYEFSWLEEPSVSSGFLQNVEGGTYNLNVADPRFSENCALDTSFTVEDINRLELDNLILVPGNCFNPTAYAEVVLNDASKDYLVTWNGGTPGTALSASNLPVGEHTVHIEEVGGECELDTTFTLSANSFNYSSDKGNEICIDNTGYININVTDPEVNISWGDGVNDVFNRTGLAHGVYNFTLSNPNDPACNVTSSISVFNINYPLHADFTYESLLDYQLPNLADIIQFENISTGDYNYVHWTFGDGGTSQQEDPIHHYINEGYYDVTLVIREEHGCADTVNKIIILENKPFCEAAMPTAFSPNKDAMNDDIGVLGDVVDFDLKVFNRWGEVIFRSQDIEKRWQGTYRNVESPIGVYPFILDYWCPDIDGELVKNTSVGQITLVR